jgi:hypothetical protein
LFLAAAGASSAAPRFSYLRGRINEYLRLEGVPLVLPEAHEWLITNYAEALKIVWADVSRRSVELADFFFIGSAAYTTVVQAGDVPDEVAGLRNDLVDKLQAQGLSQDLAHEFWASVANVGEPIPVDDLISAGLRLARRCLEPLGQEHSTAFVAMPFAEPFASRYAEFYVPLLDALGYRAIRAWGGIAFEDYWELLVTLIAKAGLMLADITGGNVNVLYEIGLAEGMDKTALLVMERSEAEPPSNLGYHAVVMYDASDPRWPAGVVTDTAVVLRAGLDGAARRVARNTKPSHGLGRA